MNGRESSAIRLHENQALFVEALNFTAADTGFAVRLIEKDYFCSLLLDYLAGTDKSLVIKGGTCLTKVYAGFYRMSEDLSEHKVPGTFFGVFFGALLIRACFRSLLIPSFK